MVRPIRLRAAVVRSGVAVAALLCSSCGPRGEPLYPVRGQVLVDGKPAEGALVVFHPVNDPGPGAVRPSARVGPTGEFSLGTHAPEDGARPGAYVVTIVWPPPNLQELLRKESTQELPDRLQGRYGNAQTSPLRATVQEAATEVPAFQLKKKG